MLIEVVLTIWLSLVVLFVPGFLLLSILSDLYVVDRLMLSPGIGVALFVVVSSGVASLWGYSYWPILWLNIILGIVLLVICYIARGFRDDFKVIVNINFRKETFAFIVFFIFLAAFAVWKLTLLEIPGDVDAQGFGYLALTVRMGGTINTLAPFYPEVKWLYSPGFFILVAFISDLLHVPINYAMLGIAYFLWLMVFPAALSVGRQFGDNRFGFLICVFLIVGRGLFPTLADSGFTSVLGCLIIIVCFSVFFRALDTDSNRIGNVMVAALTLAALCLSHPDSFIFFVLAEVPFFATVWLSRKPLNLQEYTVMLLIPLIAFLMILSWLIVQFPLFFSKAIAKNLKWLHANLWDWQIGIHQLRTIIYFNGAIVFFFAVLGMCFGSLRRERRDVFLITWVLMIIDFCAFGIIDELTSFFLSWKFSLHIYTFSLAWRGPIVPFAILAAQFTHYAIKQITLTNPKIITIQKLRQLGKIIARSSPKGGVLLMISLTTSLLFPIYAAPTLAQEVNNAADHYSFHWVGQSYAPFSTHDDLVAMRWIKNNTSEDVLVLNSPWFDGHWVPVITERKTVFSRYQPFFDKSGAPGLNIMQDECRKAFYQPDCIEARNTIYKYGITYVIVPDGTFAQSHNMDGDAFARASYLLLVFREGDAKVYRVINPRS